MPALAIHYTTGLVVVSVFISMGAAYAALSLSDRMRAAESDRARGLWLAGGSAAMGIGIWSMHYLGMLAVQLPVPVYYYWPVVLLSLAMGIGASFAALLTVIGQQLGLRRLLRGSLLMGAGIGAMHYTGMEAMRSTAMEHYNLWVVALSVVAAIVFSWLALWIAFALRDREKRGAGMLRIAGGCVMGLGIAAMHYIAMSSTSFTEDASARVSMAGTVRVNVLGETGITTTTTFVLLAALGTATLDKRRFHDLRDAHRQLEEVQRAMLEGQQKLREANARLSELSIRDSLTGLANRRHFDATLDKEWRRASRRRRPLSVLMIDVDCFKALNDRYGHKRGDDCLRRIARVLEDQGRRGYDVVARYGGEEFAVLLPETELGAATQIAQSLCKAVREAQIETEGSTVGDVVTVSIGVACRVPVLPDGADAVVADADLALYAAKRAGKNRVEVAEDMVRA